MSSGLAGGTFLVNGPRMTGFSWETWKVGAMLREVKLLGEGVDVFEHFLRTNIPISQFLAGLGLPEVSSGQPDTVFWLVAGCLSLWYRATCSRHWCMFSHTHLLLRNQSSTACECGWHSKGTGKAGIRACTEMVYFGSNHNPGFAQGRNWAQSS